MYVVGLMLLDLFFCQLEAPVVIETSGGDENLYEDGNLRNVTFTTTQVHQEHAGRISHLLF